MIAFRDNMPLIVLPNGHSVAFDRDWLARALTQWHSDGCPPKR